MSELTEALTRIQDWVEQNYPVGLDSLKPGLSLQEIEQIVEGLPFQLPPEVYELYQWRNGASQGNWRMHSGLFRGMALFDLQQAVECAIQLYDMHNEDDEHNIKYMGKPLFPVFRSDCEYLALPSNTNGDSFATVFITEIGEVVLQYSNFTSMMLMLAESYEAGAYEVDSSSNGVFYLEENWECFSPIYQKYNFNLLELSLKRLHYDIQQPEQQEEAMGNLQSTFFLLKSHWSEISIEQLTDIRAIDPLITALESPSPISTWALIELKAVIPLIQALEYGSATIRMKAAYALGEIQDFRAVEPLTHLLSDSESAVHIAAQRALDKLQGNE